MGLPPVWWTPGAVRWDEHRTMSKTKRATRCYFSMKAHIGGNAEPGLAHTVADTLANVCDISSLERALENIGPDEYVEATPKSLPSGKRSSTPTCANARCRSSSDLHPPGSAVLDYFRPLAQEKSVSCKQAGAADRLPNQRVESDVGKGIPALSAQHVALAVGEQKHSVVLALRPFGERLLDHSSGELLWLHAVA